MFFVVFVMTVFDLLLGLNIKIQYLSTNQNMSVVQSIEKQSNIKSSGHGFIYLLFDQIFPYLNDNLSIYRLFCLCKLLWLLVLQ